MRHKIGGQRAIHDLVVDQGDDEVWEPVTASLGDYAEGEQAETEIRRKTEWRIGRVVRFAEKFTADQIRDLLGQS